MTQCTHCILDLSTHAPLASGHCPNCGNRLGTSETQSPTPNLSSNSLAREQLLGAPSGMGPGAPMALFGRLGKILKQVILHPTDFFSREAPQLVRSGSLSNALAFAVIVQWLAAFFNFIWSSSVGAMFQSRMSDFMKIASDVMSENGESFPQGFGEFKERVIEFFFGAGAIVLTPFTTLIKLAIMAMFIHAAVRFFFKEHADRPQSYNTTLKVMAYATAPWILCVIPGFGFFLGWVLSFFASVIGLREVYRTTTTRATVAVAFPELLFLAFLVVGMVVMLFVAFNVLRLVF